MGIKSSVLTVLTGKHSSLSSVVHKVPRTRRSSACTSLESANLEKIDANEANIPENTANTCPLMTLQQGHSSTIDRSTNGIAADHLTHGGGVPDGRHRVPDNLRRLARAMAAGYDFMFKYIIVGDTGERGACVKPTYTVSQDPFPFQQAWESRV